MFGQSLDAEINYLNHMRFTLENGIRKKNRTGIDTLVCPYPVMIQHDMDNGFPLLTTKEVAFKPVRVELEGFIKGVTDKSWFQERGCRIWDQWASPYAVDDYMQETGETDRKKAQLEVMDLGPIYGSQWRNFNGGETDNSIVNNGSQDQLKTIVDTLKTNPDDRRMVCSAWNPLVLDEQALPPCHFVWMVQHVDGKLNLTWVQRSGDCYLGIPFNISSYALLLHLLCKETNMKEGILTGVINDFHIYENHISQVKEQLSRNPEKYDLCKIETENFASIFDWDHTMTKSIGYRGNHYPKLSAPVAI